MIPLDFARTYPMYERLKAEAAEARSSMSDRYSDAEKAAYYKKKYMESKGSMGKNNARNTSAYYNYKRTRAAQKDRQRTADAARKRGPGIISEGGKLLGGMAGTALSGTPIGTAIGGFLGGKIGHLVEQITGFGDYKIQSNSVMKGGMTPPQVVNTMNKGGYIIRHREYITDILATQNFTMQTFALNPGLATSFPWLSQIASSFEIFRFRGLLFEFKSLSSDSVLSSATSSALGAVIMSTQYNSLAPPFADKKTMENHEFANSCKPSCSMIHPIECKASQVVNDKLYVRTGENFRGDQRLYDLGEFCIATQGMQASSGVAGELWATYEIEFYQNQFLPVVGTDHFQLANVSNSAPLGTSTLPGINTGSSLGGTINAAGTIYSFPPNLSQGLYLVEVFWIGSSVAWTSPTIGLNQCVQVNLWRADGYSAIAAPNTGSTTTQCAYTTTVRVTGQGASITFSGATLPGTSPIGDLWITAISNQITG